MVRYCAESGLRRRAHALAQLRRCPSGFETEGARGLLCGLWRALLVRSVLHTGSQLHHPILDNCDFNAPTLFLGTHGFLIRFRVQPTHDEQAICRCHCHQPKDNNVALSRSRESGAFLSALGRRDFFVRVCGHEVATWNTQVVQARERGTMQTFFRDKGEVKR